MANLTPLILMAGAGFMKNSGIGVNKDLQTTSTSFTSAGTSGAILSMYPNLSPSNQLLLSALPCCLSGLYPDGVGKPAGSSGHSIVGEVMSSANELVSKGVKGFTSLLGQASSYAASAFNFQGAMAQVQGKKFDDLGFTFSNFNDLASCGVTSQFSASSAQGLGSEMPRLGSLFDVSNLYSMAKPGSVCNQLISLGLGSVGALESRLEDAGLDLTNLENEDQDIVLLIMEQIEGPDLEEILSVTECNPFMPEAIQTLADVMNINNMLGPEVTSEIDSFDSLANKLSNIGGNFSSAKDVGEFYSGLEIAEYPTLASIGTMVPDSLVEELQGTMGVGSGQFGNPTALDIVGSASGVGYTDNIKSCVDLQEKLLTNSTSVQALQQYLSSTAPESIDPARLESLVNGVNSDPYIQTDIANASSNMIDAAMNISNERKNQSIADLKLGDSMLSGSVGGLLSMTNQLPGMGLDPMNLGLREQLSKMSTDDVHGEALQASLAESRNMSRFAVFGITPGQKLDAMAYSKQLSTLI